MVWINKEQSDVWDSLVVPCVWKMETLIKGVTKWLENGMGSTKGWKKKNMIKRVKKGQGHYTERVMGCDRS